MLTYTYTVMVFARTIEVIGQLPTDTRDFDRGCGGVFFRS